MNRTMKNPAASCEESSIPMERKHTCTRSLTPKQASRNALAVGFKIAALLAALLPALFSRAFGQNQEASMAGFQFLDFIASPRPVAMGHAGTALGGSGFASYNPVSPAITDRPYLNLGYAPLPSENTIAFCEGAWMFLNMFAAAAITNEFIGGIIPADFRDGPDYDIPGSYDGTMLSLCFGYR